MGFIKRLLRNKWVLIAVGAVGVFLIGGKIRQTAEDIAAKIKPQ
jgi:hypothetical protein